MNSVKTYPAILRNGLDLVLVDSSAESGDVRVLTFRDAQGRPLPSYTPGSHLAVDCGDTVNAYSLTGPGLNPREYSISVLRSAEGAGGSRYMHTLSVGDMVRASRPRSAFAPVSRAKRHVLVAAGIGVTPMLSHARAAALWGRRASVVYVHQKDRAAHLSDLRQLAAESDQVDLLEIEGRGRMRETVSALLADCELGSHLYVCGPAAFMDEALDIARGLGWPESRLHSEAFGAAALEAGARFVARISSTGERIDVPPGISLLEALEATGRQIPNMCRQGVCGECVLGVSLGRPLHRDHYLSETERAENTTIMCCVSRSVDSELELSL